VFFNDPVSVEAHELQAIRLALAAQSCFSDRAIAWRKRSIELGLGIGIAVGVLTMVATSSPFPPANIPAHGLAFLLAAGLTKAWGRGSAELPVGKIVGILGATLLVSWTLFSSISWLGLLPTGHPLLGRSFDVFGVVAGQGLAFWWLFGFLTVAVPTFIIGLILTPLLYRAVRPALVRQGMIPVTDRGV